MEMTLLDSTYKPMRYVLPLCFMVVKTNVDYQIEASFVAENETQEAITEALEVIGRIARPKNIKDMEHAVASLKDSEFGSQENYPQLNNYSNKYWFSIKEVRQIDFCNS